MKSRRIISILGILLVLILLSLTLSTGSVFATTTTNTITITPTSGVVGTTITLHGEFSPTYVERWGIVYVSSADLAVGSAGISSASSYKKVIGAVIIPPADNPNPGIFDCTFHIPSVLDDGTVITTVSPGQYYVYVTHTTSSAGETNIMAKASLTVGTPVVPALNPLSPAIGPGGTSVVVSGSNFPASTTLVFKFDTTTLTPTTGDTTTKSTGAFSSTVTVPVGALAGVHPISVTVGTVTLSVNFTVGSAAAISLSAASGLAGASVTVTGSNFPVNTALTLKFDTTVLTPTSGSTATGATGAFTSVITIPSAASTGVHTVTAIAGTGTASATFNVTGGGTLPLAITPNNGPIGQSVSITGSGFTVGHTVTVVWNGVTTTTTSTVLEGGFINFTYIIPPTIHGAHTLSVVDGATTGSATYTVESTPPPTPQPLSPYMNQGVSAPITLDWQDVTDNATGNSAPVTYSLQISTSANFTTNLINLTSLATSQYILTDADMLNFTTGQTYYWRECAVDAAQNASPWTGANAFNVTQGFSFSGWIMWVVIGVVAVLLFLLGIWIGRKTAYSY
jgi:hypothetical protein